MLKSMSGKAETLDDVIGALQSHAKLSKEVLSIIKLVKSQK
jgi:hypothetical protein